MEAEVSVWELQATAESLATMGEVVVEQELPVPATSLVLCSRSVFAAAMAPPRWKAFAALVAVACLELRRWATVFDYLTTEIVELEV